MTIDDVMDQARRCFSWFDADPQHLLRTAIEAYGAQEREAGRCYVAQSEGISMNPDKYSPVDFGIQVIGGWLSNGMPTGWTIEVDVLDHAMPRWLLKEPVLSLDNSPFYCVYIRGMYSDHMTRERRKAVLIGQRDAAMAPKEKP
jgi:hypothetical protein